jgi:hypothetical protein
LEEAGCTSCAPANETNNSASTCAVDSAPPKKEVIRLMAIVWMLTYEYVLPLKATPEG